MPNGSSSSVNVYAVNSCGTGASQTINISVLDTPQVIITQQTNVLSTTATGAAYQWYLDGVALNNETGSTVTATQSGNYSLQVTDANGCSGMSNTVTVVINGIEELKANMFSVYPNPNATGNLQITTGSNLIGAKLKVFDVTGKMVLQSLIFNVQSSISTSQFSKGVYTICVETNSILFRKKFVIE